MDSGKQPETFTGDKLIDIETHFLLWYQIFLVLLWWNVVVFVKPKDIYIAHHTIFQFWLFLIKD